MDIVTGYKRSYSVVVRKLLNNEILSGYPRAYPTAVDLANGYFVLGGAQIPVMTQNELQNLTQSEYEARISLLKNYVIQQEGMNPFVNQFNENVVYDPDSCVPQEITTTTTEAPVTTTTTTSGVYPVKYGALYNWYAATDSRNIAANEWKLPTINDYQILADYLGASGNYITNSVGGKLKEIGTNYWNNPNTDATNEVGFNAKASGNRGLTFSNILYTSSFWTTSVWFENTGTVAGLSYNNNYLACVANVGQQRYYGYSIRLIKNSTTLTDGQSGVYIGNDGKIYRTICVGTQEWLEDNLVETKYHNGDWITGYDGGVYTPISNAAWAALTTEAMCFYDDLESNG